MSTARPLAHGRDAVARSQPSQPWRVGKALGLFPVFTALIFTALAGASSAACAQFVQQGTKLTAGDEVGTGEFGNAVALSADGNTAIVGGANDSSGTGAAWIWTRSGTIWTAQQKLVGSGSENGAAASARVGRRRCRAIAPPLRSAARTMILRSAQRGYSRRAAAPGASSDRSSSIAMQRPARSAAGRSRCRTAAPLLQTMYVHNRQQPILIPSFPSASPDLT